MEAFTLLKYWRTPNAAAGTTTTASNTRATSKTIVTTYSSDGEDGPYFDLEFSLPEDDAAEQDTSPKLLAQNPENHEDETESEELSELENDDEELKFAVTSNTDENVTLSPSDELFFQGDLVSIEPSEENSKLLPVSNLLKSATKFRVLLLKLKKSSSKSGNGVINLEKSEKNEERENQGKVSGKFFTVKFKVEEVPLVSLFTRDNSSKENHGKVVKEDSVSVSDINNVVSSDERKLAKETVQKYLNMVKPFYVRVSKLKFSGLKGGGAVADSVDEAAAPSNVRTTTTLQKQQGNSSSNNLQAGLKVVRKHLGKSRSASAAVSAAPPSNRRDDSLLQVQDGIQGAILHCKKSFNASRDVECSSSILSRSVSDQSNEKSLLMTPKVSSASKVLVI